ncbi:MAG TPA: type 1 glutamine amidotransferase domain-containing protein [Ilumatobacter sp.]|nr:type 1 glutamine amidotransferase domain-containing protein [Ilumatobacter sp.]
MADRPDIQTDTADLTGKRVAFLVANDGVEQVELTDPWDAVTSRGAEARLIAPEQGTVQGRQHLDRGDTFKADQALGDADAEQFDMLVLPGGVASPDELRTEPAATALVRAFVEAGKPIAAICHAPWTLVEADVLDGRRLTSWPSLRTDIVNAGGAWLDEEVVTCEGGANLLITSRKPDDLPAFCKQLIATLAGAPAESPAPA